MSHITEIKAEIRDIEALGMACQKLGVSLVEGQKVRSYYGSDMYDFCITWPEAVYDVGVTRETSGQLRLSADFFLGHIAKKLGCAKSQEEDERNLGLLIQGYAKQKLLKEIGLQGMVYSDLGINQRGNVVLELQSY